MSASTRYAMNIALHLVYCFFVFSARDGATIGREKSDKAGGIGPGASPMSTAVRSCRLFLLLAVHAFSQATDCAHKRGGVLVVASPSGISS